VGVWVLDEKRWHSLMATLDAIRKHISDRDARESNQDYRLTALEMRLKALEGKE